MKKYLLIFMATILILNVMCVARQCEIIELPKYIKIGSGDSLSVYISSMNELKDLKITPLISGGVTSKYGNRLDYGYADWNCFGTSCYAPYCLVYYVDGNSAKIDISKLVLIEKRSDDEKVYLKYEDDHLVEMTLTKVTRTVTEVTAYLTLEEIKECTKCEQNFVYDEDEQVWKTYSNRDVPVIKVTECQIDDNTLIIKQFPNTNYIEKGEPK